MLKNGKPWVRTRLAEILRNPSTSAPIWLFHRFYRDRGTVIVNDPGDFIGTNGCYHYKEKNSHMRRRRNYLVLAPHEGIIPADLWLKCRAKCARRGSRSRPRQKAGTPGWQGRSSAASAGTRWWIKHYPASGSRYLQCSGKMIRRLQGRGNDLHRRDRGNHRR